MKDGAESRRYHHGALREALLEAAEAELIEKGEDGFSLRSTAKRAGVSHAAPAHHFRDLAALLHALAARGFDRLTAVMKAEQAAAGADAAGTDDAAGQVVAAGIGYVRFAIDNPALFQLMFGGRGGGDKPAELAKAAEAGFSVLVNGVARVGGRDALTTEAGWRDVMAVWAIMHGYAHLAIGGKVAWLSDQPFEAQRAVIADQVRRALRLAEG
ncbi:TetR-like C-terminal domain-containing protein [Roseitalea sp. MMSF_3504]|nr:TetR-like C-terminal domain-containing protein [Roseitalea sp. MMSF_3504]